MLRSFATIKIAGSVSCVSCRGKRRVPQALEKNAELDVKLDRAQYKSGDDIAVSVTAPYAGSGLITIERDKVYGYAWFQTTTSSSIQRIRVPEGFEGSGYVNVTFRPRAELKRDLNKPTQLWRCAFHRQCRKAPTRVRLAGSGRHQTRRTAPYLLQNGSRLRKSSSLPWTKEFCRSPILKHPIRSVFSSANARSG